MRRLFAWRGISLVRQPRRRCMLFNQGTIVNVGLSSFADTVAQSGGSVGQVEWPPPAAGDRDIGLALARLVNHPHIETANQKAFDLYLQSQPVLVGIGVAAEASPEEASLLARAGRIDFAPCHHHAAVGPMAGVISPSMPVWIVENANGGNRAYSNMNEGLGKVLRFGANGREVIDRLNWIADTLKPVLEAGLGKLGPVEMKPLIAQALHMGDECHNRNAAASALFFRRFVPAVLQADLPSDCLRESLNFLAGNDHFFLNLSMATCKAMLDAAHGVKGSSMVTAMARNGVRFGIRMSGTGDTWFEADALPVDGLYFPSYGPGDAARDLGDSAITETAGIGGFAMAAAPAIVQFVGGTPDDAIANTMSMTHVTFGRNNALTLPPLNFGGTPAGIDARKVLDTNILPIINTGIAHKEAGVGQIGAGLTRAPLDCFAQAIKALAASVE